MHAGAQARGNAAFGQGVGDIFLDNVVCDGNELRLIDCASNPLAAHNCLHSEDAGVVCQPAISRMKFCICLATCFNFRMI
jgi:deleted-in-malignant-brain-tumors protein 1